MRAASLELEKPGLSEAICDPGAMAFWECLRRRREPATAAELARATDRRLVEVQHALDRLERAGLVKVRRASARRRKVAYEVAVRAIAIVVDPERPAQVELLRRIVGTMGRDLEREHFRHALPVASAGAGGWNYRHCNPLSLDPEDLDELKRRIARVEEFIRLLNDKQGRSGAIRRCNHAIAIRVEPLGGNVLPQPHVELLSRRSAVERRTMRGLAHGALTPRETEVARGLRDGQSRAEVAARLGISVLTVGTLCKRIYRKLGIRRSAELHQFALE